MCNMLENDPQIGCDWNTLTSSLFHELKTAERLLDF